jgi:hypothetical protein
MCCCIYFLLSAWFMQPAIKAQEQEQPQLAAARNAAQAAETQR